MKKLLVATVSAIVLSGCVATNQQGGTLVGAGLGGLLGSQFGDGDWATGHNRVGCIGW